jgi:hypothetical protein
MQKVKRIQHCSSASVARSQQRPYLEWRLGERQKFPDTHGKKPSFDVVLAQPINTLAFVDGR